MTMFPKILTGVAGIAMIAGAAAPAAAQSYPQGGYGGYNNNGGIIGSVINQVLGGGRYGAYGQGNDRVGVDQCARAAEARVNHDQRGRYGSYNQGYGHPAYGNHSTTARVVGITSVDRRSSGLRVSGVIDSGMHQNYGGYGNQGYGNRYDPRYPNSRYGDSRYGNQGYGAQGYSAQAADLRFSCRVDFRGRVTNLDIKRNTGVRRGY